MGTLRALVTAAEKTPIEIRQLQETKLKVGAAFDKVDEVKKQNPNATKVLEKDFTGRGTHYTYAQKEFNQFDTYKSSGDAWETSGVHIGTGKAASDRARDMLAAEYQSNLKTDIPKELAKVREKQEAVVPVNKELLGGDKGHVLDLRFREGKAAKGDLGIMTEDSARLWLEEQAYDPALAKYIAPRWDEFVKSEKAKISASSPVMPPDYPEYLSVKDPNKLTDAQRKQLGKVVFKNYGQLLGQFLADEKGYTHLPYVNAQEDAGSVSYIIFDPHKNLRRSDAAFMSEYGGLKAGVAGAAGAAGLAAQSDGGGNKSENKSGTKTTIKVKLKSKSNGT